MSPVDTPRLFLRPMVASDFNFLHKMWSEPRFCQAMNFGDVGECLFHNRPVRRFERLNPHV
jgi:hypothetical protein